MKKHKMTPSEVAAEIAKFHKGVWELVSDEEEGFNGTSDFVRKITFSLLPERELSLTARIWDQGKDSFFLFLKVPSIISLRSVMEDSVQKAFIDFDNKIILQRKWAQNLLERTASLCPKQ